MKLEKTLDKLLLFSCKNMDGSQLQQEFDECEVIGERLKRMSAERKSSPLRKHKNSSTPEQQLFTLQNCKVYSSAKKKLNDSLNFDYNELDKQLKAH